MDKKYFIEKVESVLNDFPIETRKNYFDNKENLCIEFKNTNEILYDGYENKIVYSKEEALPYGLFSMAFRDKSKLNKVIQEYPDSYLYYDIGVAMKALHKGKNTYLGKSLTNGFVEYLTRKCCDYKNDSINYYFVNLLISIYGEDILMYPLENDPIGLLCDDRFYDINRFSRKLEDFNSAKAVIKLISQNETTLEKILQLDNAEEFNKIFNNIYSIFKSSLVSLFDCIIQEYRHCLNPKIDKLEFIKLLESFFTNLQFEINLDNICSVKKEVSDMINEFKKLKFKKFV